MSSDTRASTDKFLFLFNPDVDDTCVCGISHKIAVRIVSVFLILASLNEFFEALGQGKLWTLLWNVFFAIFFLSIAFFAFLSTINEKYEYANVANIVYSINAYYDCIQNEICFPAGILQYPFFNLSTILFHRIFYNAKISSATAAILPSTFAVAFPTPMGPFTLMISVSNVSTSPG